MPLFRFYDQIHICESNDLISIRSFFVVVFSLQSPLEDTTSRTQAGYEKGVLPILLELSTKTTTNRSATR